MQLCNCTLGAMLASACTSTDGMPYHYAHAVCIYSDIVCRDTCTCVSMYLYMYILLITKGRLDFSSYPHRLMVADLVPRMIHGVMLAWCDHLELTVSACAIMYTSYS